MEISSASGNNSSLVYSKAGSLSTLWQVYTDSTNNYAVFRNGVNREIFKIFESTKNVGIDEVSAGSTFSDVASAKLFVNSTTKGFLPPRLTTVQRDAIASPATGLSVYNTTTNTIDYYNATSWISGGVNIYNSDGTLTGNRTVTTGANTLTFNGTVNFDGGDLFILRNKFSTSYNGAIVIAQQNAKTSGYGQGNVIINTRSTFTNLTTTGTYNTLIGANAGAALTTGVYNTMIGSLAGINVTSGSWNTYIGTQSSGTTSDKAVIQLTAGSQPFLDGVAADMYPTNQNYAFIGGGYYANEQIQHFYFGAAPLLRDAAYPNSNKDLFFYAPSASQVTDRGGGNFTINAGRGTGTGTPGDIIFATATPTSTGTTLQTLTNRVWIKGETGNVGIGASPNASYKLDVTGSLRVTSFILLGGEISGPLNTYFNGPTINTGTFNLRYANAQLPATNASTLTTGELTVSSSNTVASIVGTGIVSFRISNTTSGATWFFENNRNAPAGSLEITNSISNAGVTLFTTRNVGINTNTDAGFKLDVQGTARVNGDLTLKDRIIFDTLTKGIQLLSGFPHEPSIIIGSQHSAYPTVGNRHLNIGVANSINNSASMVTNIGFTNVLSAHTTGLSTVIGIFNTLGANAGTLYPLLIGGSNNYSPTTSLSGTPSGLLIGTGNTCNFAFSSIIGWNNTATAQNQLIFGYSQSNVSTGGWTDVYFGTGVRSGNQNLLGKDVTINSSGAGAGADLTGGALILAGGKSTGAAISPDVIFATATPTTSGTTLQTLTNRVWIKGSTGNLLIASGTDLGDGAKLQVNGGGRINHLYAHTTGVYTSGLFSFTSVTTATSPSYTSGMFYGAGQSYYRNEFQGSATIPNSVIQSAQFNGTQIRFVNSSTAITMTQGVSSGIRAYASEVLQFSFDNAQTACSVSHVAGMQILAPYYQGANNPTITNFYGIVLNDSTEYSGTLSITNRWGIYQNGASDNNYFKGKVIIGSTDTVGVSPLNVKNLPTSSAGLATGDVWNDAGTLKIV
jgi:hypothetical protein